MERIPKIIHYCWFGYNEKPEFILECMKSWKKYLPDWEIIEWNEDNYDVHKIAYTSEAYEAKKWAFVSDYARFDILYQYGGVYLDVDVEFLKLLPENFLELDSFTGFESGGYVAPGLIYGTHKGNQLVKLFLDLYQKEHFEISEDGKYKTVNMYMDEVLLGEGLIHNNRLQTVKGLSIYPSEVFCGYDTDIREPKITENTICKHHYYGSWLKPTLKMKIQDILKKIVGKKTYKELVLLKRKLTSKMMK